jgi:Rrf2 family protein
MKLSSRGEYALRALLVLSQCYGENVVRVQVISDRQNIPKRFLDQILADLKAGGFVESKRGNTGGYRLAASPEKIQLSNVIRYIEGALAPVSCASLHFYKPCSCPSEEVCAIRTVMQEVRDAIVKVLDNVTLADLAKRSEQLIHNSSGLANDFMI